MPSLRFPAPRVAVVGAGLAGAACARALADAGATVQVFDKSRGVGGRMATRRAEWPAADASGQPVPVGESDPERAVFDHGVAAFTARSPAFRQAVEQAQHDGLLARWTPRLAPGLAALAEPWWVAQPDMPAWCRALLQGVALKTGAAVDTLRSDPFGWSLQSAGTTLGDGFDAVVVAIPPAQSVALLSPHGGGGEVDDRPLQPCWTLMAVTDEPPDAAGWDLACPTVGRSFGPTLSPIASIVRNDAKPGRLRVPGRAHWLVHATAEWSQQHLEAPAETVRAVLQAALEDALLMQSELEPGQPREETPDQARPLDPQATRGRSTALTWHHAVVHRWRYANAVGLPAAPTLCAWNAASGLGACGDALGGGGVEGAWRSGVALARLIHHSGPGSQARRPGTSSSLASLKRFP